MEPLLDRIRKNKAEVDKIFLERTDLFREAVRLGLNWKEVAMIDSMMATKLCKEHNGISLMAAKELVDKWLSERKVNSGATNGSG